MEDELPSPPPVLLEEEDDEDEVEDDEDVLTAPPPGRTIWKLLLDSGFAFHVSCPSAKTKLVELPPLFVAAFG